jgi:large subunit ribosomal protein L33
MAKKKGVRIIVTLECTEARAAGETPSRYCTQKVSRRPGCSTAGRARAGLWPASRAPPPPPRRRRARSPPPPLLPVPVCCDPQNRRNTPERLELMKYNKNLRKYTLHREIK